MKNKVKNNYHGTTLHLAYLHEAPSLFDIEVQSKEIKGVLGDGGTCCDGCGPLFHKLEQLVKPKPAIRCIIHFVQFAQAVLLLEQSYVLSPRSQTLCDLNEKYLIKHSSEEKNKFCSNKQHGVQNLYVTISISQVHGNINLE